MEMKRLTEIDEYGNADIIGMEDETWQMGLSFNDMNKVTLALNRLHRLEKLYEQHKQPDPKTGLLPCGCGGKPRGQEQDHGYYIECDKCHLTTTKDLYLFGNEYKCQDLESARNDWSRAMGWKGGAE